MNPNTKGGSVKLPIDAAMRIALDAARRNRRTTRTGYVRAVLLQALRNEGLLNEARR